MRSEQWCDCDVSLGSTVLLTCCSLEEREITQIHFSAWPDHGVPNTTKNIFDLVSLVCQLVPQHGLFIAAQIEKHETDRPTLVHCSAGVGRTGVVLTVLNCKDEILDKVALCMDVYTMRHALQGIVDVMGQVNTLRTQRMLLVQTPEQYVFVYKVLFDFVQVLVVMFIDECLIVAVSSEARR